MYFSYFTRYLSGAQLINIILNYYYCHHNNLEYGGPIIKKVHRNHHHYHNCINETNKLIHFLNLPNSKKYIPSKKSHFEIYLKNL